MSFTFHPPTDPPHSRRKTSARWLLWTALAVAAPAGSLWLLSIRPHPVSSKAAPEVPRTGLILREGRLFQPGAAVPFTGCMVDFYESGQLKSRSTVAEGLLHGVSEGWHTNGQVQVRETFRHGVSHGVRLKWYASGARRSEAAIVEGKLHGPFRRWHENGTLAEEVNFVEGHPHGLALAYFPSGSLKARAQVQNGQVLARQSWPDGQLRP